MRYYIGRNQKEYTLSDKVFARGGEGEIVEVIGSPDLIAKLFHSDKRTEARHHKILAMLRFPPAADTALQVTWPQDLLYENDSFIGYVMPKLSGMVELNVMYSDRYKTTWRNYIKIAKNLCVAVNAIHEAGHVCGDLNPLNISVNPANGRVTLVDTDSYHITDLVSGKIYRCEVGLPDYIPKEVQEKMTFGFTLQSAPLPTYSKETDYFALAVHIFAILMNGCHPFACAILPSQKSVVQPQLRDNICRGIFPFINNEEGTTIPVYAPPIMILPQKLRQLFIRAFILGNTAPSERPGAVEWHQALDELENNLCTCSVNAGHRYYKDLPACPWCDLRNKISGFLPESLSTGKLEQTSFSIPTIRPVTANISKHITINRIRMFESDVKQVPDIKNRTYSYTFHKNTTRGILFEISFVNHTKTSIRTTLNYKLYNRYGAIVMKTSNTFLLDPTFDTYWWGWEFIDRGSLSEGKYKIEVWFDHSNTVSSEFDVINPPQQVTPAAPFSGAVPNTTTKVAAASLSAASPNPLWNKNIAASNGSSSNNMGTKGKANLPAARTLSYSRARKKSFPRTLFISIMLAAIIEVCLIILYKNSDGIPLQQLYLLINNRYDVYPGSLLPELIFYFPILFLTLLIKITINLMIKIKYGFQRIAAILVFLTLFILCIVVYEAGISDLYMNFTNRYMAKDRLFASEVSRDTRTSQWSKVECSLQDLPVYSDISPELACDGDSSTAWSIDTPNYGINEWIKLNKEAPSTFYQLSIINGDILSEDTYYNNNRVKRIGIIFADGTELAADLADRFLEPQIISFHQGIRSEYIKIKILEIYPGSLLQSTCISEIMVLEGSQ